MKNVRFRQSTRYAPAAALLIALAGCAQHQPTDNNATAEVEQLSNNNEVFGDLTKSDDRHNFATAGKQAATTRERLESLGYGGDAKVESRKGLHGLGYRHGSVAHTPANRPNSPALREYDAVASKSKTESVAAPMPPRIGAEFHTEQYDSIEEPGFLTVANRPLSTFSIDVDTASYSNVRRILTSGSLPPAGAVRIEEMINYFTFDDPTPQGPHPFTVATEVADAPWYPGHKLVRIGLRGRALSKENTPPRNLVFLIDVSGSMMPENKLGLVRKGLSELTKQLRAEDHVAICVYAGASGCVLDPTSGADRNRILEALGNLRAGGSTNGAAGIRLAYQTARKHFDGEGINRVILATDGDFNVGTTSRSELVELIEKERESGVFLTVLGVGMGNLKDATMEQLADHGNGNYAYLDSFAEARKVLVEQAGGTLVTIAKDVKIQVEFNPSVVRSYRLIGYENRRLQDKDFNDDTKDAGEIGAGHSVTALYEVIPTNFEDCLGTDTPEIDPLRYQRPSNLTGAARSGELATVKLRYKNPDAHASKLLSVAVRTSDKPIKSASTELRFSAAVAAFGMSLRGSDERGNATFEMAGDLARGALGRDPGAYRAEFLRLVSIAGDLSASTGTGPNDESDRLAGHR